MTDRTLIATPDPDEPKPYARPSITIGELVDNPAANLTVYTTAQTWTGTSSAQPWIFRTA
jgi:hypothetical protein